MKSFPIDCHKIIHCFEYKLIKYSSLTNTKRNACFLLSEDAVTIREKKNIFYNDEKPETRIRFSLMHELGHILLNSEDEFAANVFASNILAPRIAIQYSCKNYKDVMNLFGLSEEAANIAFNDYKRWRLYIVNHNNKMSEIDNVLYRHFYNQKIQKFVYRSTECMICGRKMYNTYDRDCGVCTIPRYSQQAYSELDRQLLVAENNWLYGE